jgi:putative endonuclease
MNMWYVYFLTSQQRNDYIYVGYTSDLKRRLAEHNADGSSFATAPYRPLKLVGYVAVIEENIAKDLEKYFKSGSGKALVKKRFLPR